ncbi:hypothetical protein TYRP_005099 [Tyrophagus putrescentiae]|nr:hypothetical protein TYRP_005099 [Tyrophagus putrescentiae]
MFLQLRRAIIRVAAIPLSSSVSSAHSSSSSPCRRLSVSMCRLEHQVVMISTAISTTTTTSQRGYMQREVASDESLSPQVPEAVATSSQFACLVSNLQCNQPNLLLLLLLVPCGHKCLFSFNQWTFAFSAFPHRPVSPACPAVH